MSTGEQLRKQGLELYRSGRFEEAMTAFADARQAFESAGSTREAAESANDRGVAARQAGRLDEAEIAFRQARGLFISLADLKAEGQVTGNLGALAESRRQNDEAAALYKDAVGLLERAGAPDLAAETWRALSRLRMKQGRWFQALGAYEAGMDNLQHLSLRERLLRWLLRILRPLLGGR